MNNDLKMNKLTIHTLPFRLRWAQGAIGKKFVIKHYKKRRVITKFPDMTRIIASKEQRKCRDLFKEAVAYALSIIRNKEKKEEWRKKLRKKSGDVYNALIKAYMLESKARIKEEKELKAMKAVLRLIKPKKTLKTRVINLRECYKGFERIEKLNTG
jgi:hypothetical protein